MLADYEDDDYFDPMYDTIQSEAIITYELEASGCINQNNEYSPYYVVVYDVKTPGVLDLVERITNDLDTVCRRQLSNTWFNVRRVNDNDDLLFVLYHSLDKYDDSLDRILGFAACADMYTRTNGKDNSLYIDAICANAESYNLRFPGGKALLNAVGYFAYHNGFLYLSLNALVHVVNYYRKLGFRFLRNNEQVEDTEIATLANQNSRRVFTGASDANRHVMIERAIMFSREVDEEGNPVLNMDLLRENLQHELALQHVPSVEEAERLVNELPESVRIDGSGGVHDLYYRLIKKGYAPIERCKGITKRLFVKPEQINSSLWKNWITCDESGFSMRKPLLPSLNPPGEDLSAPIIDCWYQEMPQEMHGGRLVQRHRKSYHKRRQTSKRRHGTKRNSRKDRSKKSKATLKTRYVKRRSFRSNNNTRKTHRQTFA